LIGVFGYLCTPDTSTNPKQTNKMKKLFTLLFVAGTMCFVACGPSAEEKAKMEAEAKAKMDSLFNAASQTMTMDSAATAMPDSAATAAPATTEEKK
jgi:hypothetical protein